MKTVVVFWDMILRMLVEVYLNFGETCWVNLQGRRESEELIKVACPRDISLGTDGFQFRLLSHYGRKIFSEAWLILLT
jgi:hypothetical protein